MGRIVTHFYLAASGLKHQCSVRECDFTVIRWNFFFFFSNNGESFYRIQRTDGFLGRSSETPVALRRTQSSQRSCWCDGLRPSSGSFLPPSVLSTTSRVTAPFLFSSRFLVLHRSTVNFLFTFTCSSGPLPNMTSCLIWVVHAWVRPHILDSWVCNPVQTNRAQSCS